MLVIIFAYIIHTIMAKSTIQHIKNDIRLMNVRLYGKTVLFGPDSRIVLSLMR